MANPYSTAHNFNQVPLYQNQFDLLAVGLQAREQGLAQGRDKVQQAYDQYANLDIYKDVDKQYAQDRLAEIMSYTDKYSGMDLSNPNLASSIVKNQSQVLDNNVLNAISSTKLFKAEQAEWEEKKTKEPKLYSDGNRKYAMQFSEEWRNSDEVGATYRGGGGFREFIDVEGYMTENLPKIAKDLGMTYIETTPGNGVFREDVTKEVVPRWKVQQALEGALNPKMKEQLQINAWNTYNDVPEEAIKMAYIQEYEKDLNFYQEQKDKYEALRNTTTDPRQRQIYEDQINQFDQGITGLNQNSYDRVGRTGAYSALYMKEWKDNYLDAYSHDPIEVKRDVNALDEATANYKMKVAEFNLSQAKFEETKSQNAISNQLRAQQLEINKASLALKAQGKTSTSNGKGVDNPFGESLSVVETAPIEKENAMSEVEWIKQQEYKAYNQFTKMFEDKVSKEDLSSKSLIAALKSGGNGQDKQEVTLKSGKKVTINWSNPSVNAVATNYANLVLDDAPVQKRAYDQFNKTAEKTQQKLVNASRTGDIGGSQGFQDRLPQYNIKIVGTDGDNFKIVPTENNDKFNYYRVLTAKKAKGAKLSYSEQATLDLYTKMTIAYSDESNQDVKTIAEKAINKEYFYKSKSKVGAFTVGTPVADPKTGRYISKTTGGLSVTDVYRNGGGVDPGVALSKFGAWDLSSESSFSDDISNLKTSLESDFKASRGTTNYNQTRQVIVVSKESNPKTWGAVETIFPGKLEKDFEVNIIPNVYGNGKPTGTSRLVVTDKEGEIVDKGDIELSEEQFQSLTGRTQQIKRDAFDATFGDFAQTLPLGTGSIKDVAEVDGKLGTDRYRRLQGDMYQSPSGGVVPFLSREFSTQVIQDYSEVGMQDLALRELKDLESNAFSFKVEPLEGVYTVGVYKNGKKVHVKSLEQQSLNTDQITELKNKSQVIARQAFLDYLQVEAIKTGN